jgi:hypothetical protein
MKGIRLFLTYIAFVLLGCGGVSRIPQDIYLANQGFVELSNGNYLRAEANLLVALDLNPNNPYALLNLGAVYQDTARTAEAVQMYKRIIELNPEEGAVESNKQGCEGKTLVEIARENLSGLGVILAERGSPIDLTEMEKSTETDFYITSSDIVSNNYFQSFSDTATRHSSASSVVDQQNSISVAGGDAASGSETSGIGASAGTVGGGVSGSDSGNSGGYDGGGGTGGASQGGEGGSGGGVGAGGGGSGGSSGAGGNPGSGSSAPGVGGGASDGASGGSGGGNAGGNR